MSRIWTDERTDMDTMTTTTPITATRDEVLTAGFRLNGLDGEPTAFSVMTRAERYSVMVDGGVSFDVIAHVNGTGYCRSRMSGLIYRWEQANRRRRQFMVPVDITPGRDTGDIEGTVTFDQRTMIDGSTGETFCGWINPDLAR